MRWHGLNASTGLPWNDDWVGVEARDASGRPMLNGALKKEAKDMEAVKFGLRAPQRRRGQKREAATASTTGGETKRRKWRTALRGGGGETEEREMEWGMRAVRRAVRANVRIREEEVEESVEERKRRLTSEGWANLLKQRRRPWAGVAWRKRRAVVESDPESDSESEAAAEGGTREGGGDTYSAGGSGREGQELQQSAEAGERRTQVAQETGDVSASRRESGLEGMA